MKRISCLVYMVAVVHITVVGALSDVEHFARCRDKGAANLLTPSPIVIGREMNVTCSLAAIGGRSKLVDLEFEAIPRLGLWQKSSAGWKLLADYDLMSTTDDVAQGTTGSDYGPRSSITDLSQIPGDLTKENFIFKGGYREDKPHTNTDQATDNRAAILGNTDKMSVSLRKTNAQCDLVRPYACSIHYWTSTGMVCDIYQHDIPQPRPQKLLMTASPNRDTYTAGDVVKMTCKLKDFEGMSILWKVAKCKAPNVFKSLATHLKEERGTTKLKQVKCDDPTLELTSSLTFTVTKTYCQVKCVGIDSKHVTVDAYVQKGAGVDGVKTFKVQAKKKKKRKKRDSGSEVAQQLYGSENINTLVMFMVGAFVFTALLIAVSLHRSFNPRRKKRGNQVVEKKKEKRTLKDKIFKNITKDFAKDICSQSKGETPQEQHSTSRKTARKTVETFEQTVETFEDIVEEYEKAVDAIGRTVEKCEKENFESPGQEEIDILEGERGDYSRKKEGDTITSQPDWSNNREESEKKAI